MRHRLRIRHLLHCTLRKRAVATLVLLTALLLMPPFARALEIHSFVDDRCQVSSGILVRVDESQVHFITLAGTYQTLPVDGVAMLVIHKVLENPLPGIGVNDQLRGLAREIRTGRDEASAFVGWPVAFYDQLVIFFDTEGRSHVLEPQDIQRIRPLRASADEIRPAVAAPVTLDFPPELLPCALPRSESGVRPSRVLGDRIKVDDYLVKLRDRYSALDGFEERTWVYPRPFVFDPTMRLGLSYFSGKHGALVKYFPLNFQWSGGRPYRFQSHSTVGMATSPWLPFVEPTLGFQSDVKSHFFTASFVGHLMALPAGSSAFENEEALLPLGTVPAVDELYNYLVLMGADWGPISLSGGALYRSVRIAFSKDDWREIKADAMTPVGRLMWTGANVRVRAMYFRTRQERSKNEGWRGPYDSDSSAQGYALSLDSVRAGVDVDLPMDLSLSADQILTFGSYRETTVADIDILHALTSATLTAQFSRYVAVKGYLNLLHRRYQTTLGSAAPTDGVAGTTTRTNLQLGGALEFLF